ncbi:MAG TPA: DHA2 family efflux MFS transporter permease subunit [Dokdonella sp.]
MAALGFRADERAAPLHGGALVLLTLAVALATFMEVLDISIVNVSVQTIAGNLGVTPSEGTWAISAYSLASAVMQPLTGWISRRYGEVRTFCVSVALFVVFSTACGFAASMPMLVVLRLLQGLVSGPMVPLSQALLLRNYPEEKRSLATGLWAMTVVVAPIFGPILGGWITDNYSWPWIFFINVPVGVAALLLAFFLLRERESRTQRVPVDAIGLFLLAVGVGSLQFMLDKGNENDWFSSPMITALGIVALVCLSFLIPWEIVEENRVVNLLLFRRRNFLVGVTALTFGMFAFFGGTVVLPRWLQDVMGYNATWAGLAIAPIGVLSFLFSPLVGALQSRLELRLLVSLGFFVFAFASFWASHFTEEVSYFTVVLPRFVQGFGVAMFFVPVNQILLSGLGADEVASASGLANFFRTLASSVSTAVTTTLYDHRATFHHARLAENVQAGAPALVDYLQPLQHGGLGGLAPYAAVDQVMTLQAQTLAVNDVLWLFGCVFAAIALLIWLAKPPFGASGAAPG